MWGDLSFLAEDWLVGINGIELVASQWFTVNVDLGGISHIGIWHVSTCCHILSINPFSIYFVNAVNLNWSLLNSSFNIKLIKAINKETNK